MGKKIITMTQTMSIEKHPEGVFTKVLTTTYNSGVVSKRYLDAHDVPFDIIWVKPVNVKPVIDYNIIEHREVELYQRYLLVGRW